MKPIHKLNMFLASAMAAYAFGQPNSAVQFYDSTGVTPTSKFGWQGSAAAGKFYIETPNGGAGFSLQNGNMNLDGNIKATSFTGNGAGLTGITAVGASAGEVATTLKADAAFLTSVKGATGAQGPMGPAGPVGPAGPAGSGTGTGTVGPAGPAGPTGPQGPIGLTGAAGPAGPAGATGPAGPAGAKGADGVSPTSGAVATTLKADAAFLTSVKGATGATGAAGTPGLKGDKGDPGATGATGPAGPGFALGTLYNYNAGNYAITVQKNAQTPSGGGANFWTAQVKNGRGASATGDVAAVLAGYVGTEGYAGYFSGRVLVETDLSVGGCAGCSNNTSDQNLKKDIMVIESAGEKLKKIKGVSFNWNEKGPKDTKPQFGVIAQDVQKVLPNAVSTRENGTLSVEYNAMTALLIEAVKEQSVVIEKQQKQIDELYKLLKK